MEYYSTGLNHSDTSAATAAHRPPRPLQGSQHSELEAASTYHLQPTHIGHFTPGFGHNSTMPSAVPPYHIPLCPAALLQCTYARAFRALPRKCCTACTSRGVDGFSLGACRHAKSPSAAFMPNALVPADSSSLCIDRAGLTSCEVPCGILSRVMNQAHTALIIVF